MSTQPQIVKLEGDVRVWKILPNLTEVPVNPDADDPKGNRPLECDGAIFEYEAGDVVEVKSKGRDRYNQTIYSEQEPGTPGLNLTLLEVPPSILGVMFAATQQPDVTVSTAAVTDEAHTDIVRGEWFSLGKRYLRTSVAPVVKKGSDVIAADKYEVDYRRGRIKVDADAAGVADGDDLTVSYTHETYLTQTFYGGLAPEQKFRMEFDCKNRANGDDFEVDVPIANLAREGNFDVFASEPLKPGLKGSLILKSGQPAPYIVHRRVVTLS